MAYEDMIQEEEDKLKDPLEAILTGDEPDDEDVQTAFTIMKGVMDKYKDFCDACEGAWKVQEIPALLRQRLIALDQSNQERYQKMYVLMQRYAEDMKNAYIKTPDA
jgi:hypothetical protein